MWRRISTKLVVAVLAAVVLPFVAFAFFINEQMADRLTRHVVQQSLMGLAKDIAGQIDTFVRERRQDVEQLAGAPQANHAIDEDILARRDRTELWDADTFLMWTDNSVLLDSVPLTLLDRFQQTAELDRVVALKRVFDLVLLLNEDGQLVTCNSNDPAGVPIPTERVRELFARDYSGEAWFREALGGAVSQVDQHQSPLRLRTQADEAWNRHLGFAAPVRRSYDPEQIVGVLYGLANWGHVQEIANAEVVRDYFRGLVAPGRQPSPYAWIWRSDADTIIGHPARELYGRSVSRDIRLPQMTQAVRESPSGWGLYPEYEFEGRSKNAAFQRCAGPEDGGFGWIVGIGIDNDDIYATVAELRNLLLGGTVLVLLMSSIWTLVIARRTTGPVLELQRYTRRVAQGDLDAQIAIRSKDELGELAQDFNEMTRELKHQRERIVKAEKDAAWREMARQIAHDLKNPLTPIKLSLDLLERVRKEDPKGSEEILVRTMELIRRQVTNLQHIAGEFYEFTGGRKPRPTPVDLAELLAEVLHLHDAWAVELGVSMQQEGAGGVVLADLSKLRRVLVNLVSNALQAMPEGGRLDVEAAPDDGHVRVSIRDTGEGLSEEVRGHLFEPYFTTKGEGTGLGLAISKRVIEEMGGTIELLPARDADGGGTVAVVVLPLAPRGAEGGDGD